MSEPKAKRRRRTRGAGADAERPVTRDDLEEALRALQADVDEEAEPLAVKLAYAAAALAVLAVVVAYVVGRRAGRERIPVVEIRRI